MLIGKSLLVLSLVFVVTEQARLKRQISFGGNSVSRDRPTSQHKASSSVSFSSERKEGKETKILLEAETDPKHDPDHAHNDDDNKSDDEDTSEKSELTIYLDTDVTEIEKCLPELEKKGTQLALAASCRQDILRRNLEILHSNAAEMVRKERDLKKIKENIDSMSKYKEEAVVTMENVEPLVTEPKMIEDKKEEEEILFRLDEKIQRKESEHRAALEIFNSLLETEQLKEERREKISKLKARLQELSGEK